MRTLLISWNPKGIHLAETLNREVFERNREGYLSLYPRDSVIPDFFNSWRDLIVNKDPEVVIVGFQEDAKPGSYFHSHLLPDEMSKIGYTLLTRERLISLNWSPGGLRTSIYARVEIFVEKIDYYSSDYFHRYGGLATTILLTDGTTFTVVNVKGPEGSKVEAQERQDELFSNNRLINELTRRFKPNILFGDLGYRDGEAIIQMEKKNMYTYDVGVNTLLNSVLIIERGSIEAIGSNASWCIF